MRSSHLPLNALRAFEASARQLSFTRAGLELRVTQAAVSQRIHALEQELGVPLFTRHGGVLLTDAGRVLHGFAQRILDLHQQAREEITGRAIPITGELTLATSSVPGEHILPGLLSVFHEDMHGEAFLYTRQTLGYSAPRFLMDGRMKDEGLGPLPGDVQIPGGKFQLGADSKEPFVFVNEKWAHPVALRPFAIARAPVTQAEFAAFEADDGYRRAELWGPAGWRWRQAGEVLHPVYWRREGDGWLRRQRLPDPAASPDPLGDLHAEDHKR